MLEVWTWPTPNGHKVHIALEELGLEYKVIPVNIGAGDQFNPEFLAITPITAFQQSSTPMARAARSSLSSSRRRSSSTCRRKLAES